MNLNLPGKLPRPAWPWTVKTDPPGPDLDEQIAEVVKRMIDPRPEPHAPVEEMDFDFTQQFRGD